MIAIEKFTALVVVPRKLIEQRGTRQAMAKSIFQRWDQGPPHRVKDGVETAGICADVVLGTLDKQDNFWPAIRIFRNGREEVLVDGRKERSISFSKLQETEQANRRKKKETSH